MQCQVSQFGEGRLTGGAQSFDLREEDRFAQPCQSRRKQLKIRVFPKIQPQSVKAMDDLVETCEHGPVPRAEQIQANAQVFTGPNAFVLKQAHETELLEAIARCLPKEASSSLTARENEILRWLAEGYANKDVATRLYISVKTVETHRAHLLLKLGLQSRADLIRYAVSQGFFQPG